jgi:hypothetical protein
MAEPLRLDPSGHLPHFVSTTPSFVCHREGLSRLKNLLQEMWSATLRHALQEEAIKVYRLAGNMRALAKVLVEAIEANLTLAVVRIGTLVDPQPPYFSDTTFSSVLPCARS